MRITDPQRRKLHLALASARTRLAQLHQRFAIERIVALPDEEPSAVLRGYTRSHALGKPEAESLANRALASFGASRGGGVDAAQPLLPPPPPPPAAGRLRRLLARLLRRRDPERRRWLVLHVAHAEAVLLGAHAMHVIELLEAVGGDIANVASVVDFYVRETRTRGPLREPITVIALDRLYRRRAATANATPVGGTERTPRHDVSPIDATPASGARVTSATASIRLGAASMSSGSAAGMTVAASPAAGPLVPSNTSGAAGSRAQSASARHAAVG